MSAHHEPAQVMSASEIDRTLVRLAHEILETANDLDRLVFVGIRRRGVPLARRLAEKIEAIEKRAVPVGVLDIRLYRDDLSLIASQPVVNATEIPFSVTGLDVVLTDDVLFTGRTIRAALDELIDFGRPKQIQLAVLVDRGHREFPIKADYVGRNVPTSETELVEVRLAELDGTDEVLLGEVTE